MDLNKIIESEKQKHYFQELMSYLDERYKQTLVYPLKENLFACFEKCPLDDIKVVILGQDPYHQPRQAMGLCFSVPEGVKLPPSLVNIYKELESDIGGSMRSSGDLTNWAKQGVLLLNTVMSVEDSKPNCHKNKGWEVFTDTIIQSLNEYDKPLVFVLWGKPAQEKLKFITNKNHLILTAPHPSPLSSYRGFFGSKPFSKANAFLKTNDRKEIEW